MEDIFIQTLAQRIKIEAVLADYPNCKIAIGLPAIGAPIFNDSSRNSSFFKQAIGILSLAYLENFDNGTYHPNVTCFNLGARIDRHNSYPHTDLAISDRITTTVREWTNSVHPDPVGYYQWADAYYAKIRSWLAGNL